MRYRSVVICKDALYNSLPSLRYSRRPCINPLTHSLTHSPAKCDIIIEIDVDGDRLVISRVCNTAWRRAPANDSANELINVKRSIWTLMQSNRCMFTCISCCCCCWVQISYLYLCVTACVFEYLHVLYIHFVVFCCDFMYAWFVICADKWQLA